MVFPAYSGDPVIDASSETANAAHVGQGQLALQLSSLPQIVGLGVPRAHEERGNMSGQIYGGQDWR